MKRISILLMGATLLLSSCNTIDKTARTAETLENLRSATVVDIIPATEARITHTLRPDATLLRGGEANVRQAAEHEALVKYGNADILLEPPVYRAQGAPSVPHEDTLGYREWSSCLLYELPCVARFGVG